VQEDRINQHGDAGGDEPLQFRPMALEIIILGSG